MFNKLVQINYYAYKSFLSKIIGKQNSYFICLVPDRFPRALKFLSVQEVIDFYYLTEHNCLSSDLLQYSLFPFTKFETNFHYNIEGGKISHCQCDLCR